MPVSWTTGLGHWLFPPLCLLCGAPGSGGLDLCGGCRHDLPANSVFCRRCATPLPVPGVCGRCQSRPPAFDMVVAPYLYQPPLDHLLIGLKFHGQLSHAPLLGQLLLEGLERRRLPRPEVLIPVPMHPRRLRERGFNQALEIARPVARRLGLSLRWDLAVRLRPTPPQSGLNEAARQRNLRDAFQCTGCGPLPYRHVAILDDVMTTGSTVTELARVLKDRGVATVSVWVCARTPRT